MIYNKTTPGLLIAFFLTFSNLHSQDEKLNLLLQRENFPEIISVTDSILQSDSSRYELYEIRGIAWKGMINYTAAVKDFQTCFNRTSSISSALQLASLYSEMGNNLLAIHFYKEVLQNDSTFQKVLIPLGKLYIAEDMGKEAVFCFKPLFQSDTLNAQYAYWLAQSYEKNEQTDSAILYFERAVILNPEDRNSIFRLAQLYKETNRILKGIECTDIYLERNPDDLRMLRINAYLNYLALQPQSALTRFLRCLELGDSSAFIYKYAGICYHDISRYPDAISFLIQSDRKKAKDPEVFYFLGKSYGMIGSPDSSIFCFERTIELLNPAPSFISSIYMLIAEQYNLLKQPDKALIVLHEANAIYESPENLFMLGRQFDFFQQQSDSALWYYEKFLKKADELEGQISLTREQVEYRSRAKERIKKIHEDKFWLGLDSIPNR